MPGRLPLLAVAIAPLEALPKTVAVPGFEARAYWKLVGVTFEITNVPLYPLGVMPLMITLWPFWKLLFAVIVTVLLTQLAAVMGATIGSVPLGPTWARRKLL